MFELPGKGSSLCKSAKWHNFEQFGMEGLKRVVITGVTGLIGRHLRDELSGFGYEVIPVSRKPQDGGVVWDTAAMVAEPRALLNGCHAWIHLAGESIAGRWTAARKRAIRDSRIQSSRLLANIAAELDAPPQVCVAASAIGYYGPNPEVGVNELGPCGPGFLAGVCRDWEAETAAMAKAGIRVVNLRLGVVLAPQGGALGQMLPMFKAGLGGVVGSGEQHMSWIAMDDLVAAIRFCMERESMRGPVNAVSPHPVTNREFSRALAAILGRPALIPVPAFALRFALGSMAAETLLADQNVAPLRLLEAGFAFRHESLREALETLLKQ